MTFPVPTKYSVSYFLQFQLSDTRRPCVLSRVEGFYFLHFCAILNLGSPLEARYDFYKIEFLKPSHITVVSGQPSCKLLIGHNCLCFIFIFSTFYIHHNNRPKDFLNPIVNFILVLEWNLRYTFWTKTRV